MADKQKEFCHNPECPYHDIQDEMTVKRGEFTMQDRTLGELSPKKIIKRMNFKNRKGESFWYCSICATAIQTAMKPIVDTLKNLDLEP